MERPTELPHSSSQVNAELNSLTDSIKPEYETVEKYEFIVKPDMNIHENIAYGDVYLSHPPTSENDAYGDLSTQV